MTEQEEYKKVKKLKIRAYKGQKLSFQERNFIRIYDKKIVKQNPN